MLLTRPPLGNQLASYSVSSFDLHVLSTPPAFILSQNQTLRINDRFAPDPFKQLWLCIVSPVSRGVVYVYQIDKWRNTRPGGQCPAYSAHRPQSARRTAHNSIFSSSIPHTPDGGQLQRRPGRPTPSTQIRPACAGPQCKRTLPAVTKKPVADPAPGAAICMVSAADLLSPARPPVERRGGSYPKSRAGQHLSTLFSHLFSPAPATHSESSGGRCENIRCCGKTAVDAATQLFGSVQ